MDGTNRVPPVSTGTMLNRRGFLIAAATAPMFWPRRTSAFTATVCCDRERLAAAGRAQIGVTTGYDPAYRRMAYPLGDVPRSTGICADVIVRACRDAYAMDLQQQVHEDMVRSFRSYPRAWGAAHPDANIDHRRVLNLQTFWTRAGARLWQGGSGAPGNSFGTGMRVGDFVTWLIFGRLPHCGIVIDDRPGHETVLNNIGRGAEQIELAAFQSHVAVGRYRWPE